MGVSESEYAHSVFYGLSDILFFNSKTRGDRKKLIENFLHDPFFIKNEILTIR